MAATSNGKSHPAPKPAGDLEFEFHAPDFHVPSDIVEYAQHKLTARLKKYERRLTGLVVHFRDINGVRGGDGVECHLEARLAGLEPINVEECDDDMRAAFDRALDRLEPVVGRHVVRARSTPMHRGRKVAQSMKSTPS